MYNKNYANSHDANKYMRVQDALQQTYVLVPEKDFIQHCREYAEANAWPRLTKERLERLEATHVEVVRNFAKLQETFKEEVNKARIKQRQEDAKVYAHWRDTAKNLSEEKKKLSKENWELKEYYKSLPVPEDVSWKKKYETLVSAIDAPINILENINKGHIYEEITITYPDNNQSTTPTWKQTMN